MMRVLAVVSLVALGAHHACADAVGDFYQGRQLNLIVGYGPGGGYDVYARLIARHLGKYIPGNPAVVVQNMPGAGSLRAVNYLYNVAPRDGSVIAAFARDMPLIGILGSAASPLSEHVDVLLDASVEREADPHHRRHERAALAVRVTHDPRLHRRK